MSLRTWIGVVAMTLCVAGVAAADQPDFTNSGGQNLGTPDGIPPSQETVCDGQTGAAFGLCNAYCEAMDCDSGSPQASANACSKVESRFTQITGQPLPCGCPCVGRIPGFIETLNGDYGLAGAQCFTIPGVTDFFALLGGDRLAGAQTVEQGNFGFCGFVGGPFLVITLQEARQCLALTRAKAAAAGYTCS
jgi:hypothetical protein